jgi:hypothetical protein
MIYIGIDPGLSGAVARISPKGLTVWRDFDFLNGITKAVLESYRDDNGSMLGGDFHFTIEKVASRPAQGVASTFNFGKATGVAYGAVDALCQMRTMTTTKTDLYSEVSPQMWQFWYKNRMSKIPEPLDSLARVALRNYSPEGFDSRYYALCLFPQNVDLFKRVKDHNTADAVLLAAYPILKNNHALVESHLSASAAYVLAQGDKPQLIA